MSDGLFNDFGENTVGFNPEKEWIGMPEFQQVQQRPYKAIIVRFTSEEDYKKFAELVDQNLTEQTKSIWFPKIDNTLRMGLKYVDEE